jgi:hypothetical protein
MVKVNSFEELQSFCLNVIDGKAVIADIEFGNFFNYSVKVEGEKWNKYIDVRHADLIKKVQRYICTAYAYSTGENPHELTKSEKLRIQAEVKQGSSILDFLQKM